MFEARISKKKSMVRQAPYERRRKKEKGAMGIAPGASGKKERETRLDSKNRPPEDVR